MESALIQSIFLGEGLGTKKELENLLSAEQHLRKFNDESGLIECSEMIQETHRILMKGLPYKETPPGEFSTCLRFDAKTLHKYPQRLNKQEVERFVDDIIDAYNAHIFRNQLTIDVIAQMICRLLAEHPFGDGNGRLCRLLANHALKAIKPLNTESPIWGDFTGAVEHFQNTGEHSLMTSLLITSKVN